MLPYSLFHNSSSTRQRPRSRVKEALRLGSFDFPQERSGQAGQATLGFVFLVASIIIGVSVSFVFIVLSLINSGYTYQSVQQASLAAHSGVEDALLLLARNKDFTSPGYALSVGSASVTVSVASDTPLTGETTILSKATMGMSSRWSKAAVVINPVTAVVNIISWAETTQ